MMIQKILDFIGNRLRMRNVSQIVPAYIEMIRTSKRVKNILAAGNEWFWMWLASVSPILFGSLFIKLHHIELGYLDIIHRSIGVDIVFAYVATMIAPFLFYLAKAINPNNWKEIKGIRFGGTCIVLSFTIALVTAGIFSASKGDLSQADSAVNVARVEHVVDLQGGDEKDIVQGEISSRILDGIKGVWSSMDFRNRLLAICYFLALTIWYYSIYINYAEPLNLEKAERKRVHGLMDDVGVVAEEME